jgi:hypothetical protein
MSPYAIYQFGSPSNYLGTKYETNCQSAEHLVYTLLGFWLKKEMVFPTLPDFVLPADLILKKDEIEYFSRTEMSDKDVNLIASNILSLTPDKIPKFLSCFQQISSDRIYFVREGEINFEMEEYKDSYLAEMEIDEGFIPEWVEYEPTHWCGSRGCDQRCGVLVCGCIDVCRCSKYE